MSTDQAFQGLGPRQLFAGYGNFYRTINGYIMSDLLGGPFIRNWLEENFEARPDDIYVVSFPKTGTTWAQELVYVIANDLDFAKAKSQSISERFPYLEEKFRSEDHYLDTASPRFIKSHYPYSLLPKSIDEKKCKIIYCIRNPKDTVVSYYHFLHMNPLFYSGDLETFVEYFVTNGVPYAPFYKHILEMWNHRHQDNILILMYEDMKKNLPNEVKRIASFLGKTLTEEEIMRIAEHCSFNKMKENSATNYEKEIGKQFMRKGETGDWKNYLTEEMNEKLDEYYKKYFNNSRIQFTFEL